MMLGPTQWVSKPPLGTQINWGHPITKELSASFLFNEGSGGAIYDQVGGITGAISGALRWVPGVHGSVLEGYGTTQCITVTDSRLPSMYRGPFTMSVWINNRTLGGSSRGRIFDLSSMCALTGYYGVQKYSITYNGGSSIDSAVTIVFNTWHNVVFVGSGTESYLWIYYDGVINNQGANSYSAGTAPMRFFNNSALIRHFDGWMSSIQVWTRMLSAQEIMQLYQHPYAMFEQRPVWMGYQAPSGEELTKDLADTITLSDAASRLVGMSRSDTITLSDAVIKLASIVSGDTITLTDAAAKRVDVIKADTLTMSDLMSAIITLVLALGDTITLTDSITGKSIGKVQADTITLNDVIAKAASISQSDSVTLSDSITKAAQLSVTDIVTLTDALTKNSGVSLADILTLTDVFSSSLGALTLTLGDTITLADVIDKFIRASEKQFKFKDVNTFTAKAAPGTFKFKARDTHLVQ